MEKGGKGPVILIDSLGLLFRSFYAFAGRPLKTRDGIPSSAVFGLARVFLSLAERHPSALVCAFDCPGPTFRNDLYPAYKEHRDAPPEDLMVQIPLAEEFVAAAGIPAVKAPGFEADDIIATLARRSREEGHEVIIVTGDKDLFQLVGPGLSILNAKGNVPDGSPMDAEAVREKLGVPPAQVRDFLALTGDASDNVPGVPGIGPKTAAKLLAEHGTFEKLYQSLDRLPPGKLRQSLVENREQAELSQRLVTLRFDVPLPGEGDLAFKGLRWETLNPFLKRMEFVSMMKKGEDAGELFGAETPAEKTEQASHPSPPPLGEGLKVGEPPTKTTVVLTEKDLKKMLAGFKKGKLSAVDTETTSLEAMKARIVGLSVSHHEGEAFYLPLGHAEGNYPDAASALAHLAGPLGDPALPKAGSNLKYDAVVLAQAGCPLRGIASDCHLASFLLDADKGRHGLKALAQDRLGITMTEIDALIGSGRKQVTMDQVAVNLAAPYAAADADMALRLAATLEGELGPAGLEELYREVEIPLEGVLASMEQEGAALNVDEMRKLGQDLLERCDSLRKAIHKEAGREFLVDSPRQLGEILFQELKLPARRKTKTGFSTDVEVLEELAPLHPVPALVLEYRTLKKIHSTYVEVLPGEVHPVTGRVHTDYNQAGAATGRLSSSHPNLQNIPVRTEWGRRVRRGFVPRAEGRVLLSLDYSQIELRILAHLSGDERLAEAFRKGEDVHTRTASEVFKVAAGAVTKDMRRTAKIVNFGVLYGMGAFRLARETGLSRGEAAEVIEKYFATYASVRGYFDEVAEKARATGEVRTLLGRRRFIHDIESRNPGIREAARRAAVNTPIQGSAADLMKKAMILVAAELPRWPGVKMILQVHDELVFDVPQNDLKAFTHKGREILEGAMKLKVPLVVDSKSGPNWADMA